MSIRINIRMPEGIHKDCQAYIQNKGISLTDMIVDGLRLQLETPVLRSCPTMPEPEIVRVGAPCEAVIVPDTPIKDDPVIHTPIEPEPIPIIKNTNDVRRIVDSLPMRAYFRPCTKASQTHSAGKRKA